MRVSYVNEHICRVFKFLVTFETFAGGGILESLQLFRIRVEHQPLPLFANLKKTGQEWLKKTQTQFVTSANLLVQIWTVCYVFNKDVASVWNDIADGLEVGVPLLHDVGGDVQGGRELGAWLLLLAVEAEVVVVVFEAR